MKNLSFCILSLLCLLTACQTAQQSHQKVLLESLKANTDIKKINQYKKPIYSSKLHIPAIIQTREYQSILPQQLQSTDSLDVWVKTALNDSIQLVIFNIPTEKKNNFGNFWLVSYDTLGQYKDIIELQRFTDDYTLHTDFKSDTKAEIRRNYQEANVELPQTQFEILPNGKFDIQADFSPYLKGTDAWQLYSFDNPGPQDAHYKEGNVYELIQGKSELLSISGYSMLSRHGSMYITTQTEGDTMTIYYAAPWDQEKGNPFFKYKKGDALFRLIQKGNAIKTEWLEMKPLYPYTSSNGFHKKDIKEMW